MARTIVPASRKRSRKVAAVTPARSETRIVSRPTCGARPGVTSSSFCGFTPSMTKRGRSSAGSAVTVRTPGTGVPLGRMAVTALRSIPAACQPATIAPAILPHPTSHAGPGKAGVMASSLAGGVDQRRGDRLARLLAAPQDELEHRVKALAFFHRRFGNGLGLLERQPVALAEQGGVAEHDQARARPQFEVTEPQLLVDEAERLVD